MMKDTDFNKLAELVKYYKYELDEKDWRTLKIIFIGTPSFLPDYGSYLDLVELIQDLDRNSELNPLHISFDTKRGRINSVLQNKETISRLKLFLQTMLFDLRDGAALSSNYLNDGKWDIKEYSSTELEQVKTDETRHEYYANLNKGKKIEIRVKVLYDELRNLNFWEQEECIRKKYCFIYDFLQLKGILPERTFEFRGNGEAKEKYERIRYLIKP